MKISAIPPNLIHEVAPQCLEYLRRLEDMNFGRYRAEDLLELAAQPGEFALWIAFEDGGDNIIIKGVAVTQIVQYPRLLSLFVIAVSGDDMKRWIVPMVSTLRSYGESCGCTIWEAWGRSGWQALMKKKSPQNGVRQTAVLMEGPLNVQRI